MSQSRVANKYRLTSWQWLFLATIGFLWLAPVLPLAIQSLAFQWHWPDLLPEVWWLTAREQARLPIGWDYIFSPYSHLYEAFMNTLIIGVSVTLITLIICLPAARVLAKYPFKLKPQIELLFSTPLLLPEIALALALLIPFIRLDISGGYTGVIIAQLVPTIPYMIRILTSAYSGIRIQYEEQARLLGASSLQVFRYIQLPLLIPGIIAGCLFTFLVSSNIFLITFLIGQGSIETLPTLLFAKISGGAMDATAAGLTLVVMLPGVLFLLAVERHIQEIN